PMRRVNVACPTMPSVTAASAGANTTPAACAIAWDAATGQNDGSQGSTRDAAVTSVAAAIITARFALVASTSAPAGVCATIPAKVAIDITMPMLASSQL